MANRRNGYDYRCLAGIHPGHTSEKNQKACAAKNGSTPKKSDLGRKLLGR